MSELEERHAVEMIEQALLEMEESDEISQGAIDGLVEILEILGVHDYDSRKQY